MPELPTPVRQLAELATDAARALVADHLAPTLPPDHPLRAWSGTDEGGPRPWPALMVAPRCVIWVGSDAVPTLQAFAATASALGMQVDSVTGPDGVPTCAVRERVSRVNVLAEIDELLSSGITDVGRSVVRVRGVTVAPGSCVLQVDVDDQRDSMSRRFAGVVERFALASSEAGLAVRVGPWVESRPDRVVRLGRRRGGDARG